MSKLSFRARQLDPAKPMPIYLAEELPDMPEYSAINRAVPQMPSGMEKEEESEHHLQRAICAGLLIPTPEVSTIEDEAFYDRIYPANYKMPRQNIHMQPLGMDQDIPDYDMDSADELWVEEQSKRMDLDVLKFEMMMDKLEKSSGQTVVTLNEAKALLKQDDELSIAVYDYWLNKRLTTQHPLILSVKTENRGNMAPNNPYLAFRRRTEKMQTRKNRKNDESSYEKMLKLRRDLSRAVTLLEMVRRRESKKREQVEITKKVFEKRYECRDFSGQIVTEILTSMARNARPACAPLYSNQHHSQLSGLHHQSQWSSLGGSGTNASHHFNSSVSLKSSRELDASSLRKEKRQYKKRKHKLQKDKSSSSSTAAAPGSAGGYGGNSHSLHHAGSGIEPMMSSDEDDFNGNNAHGSESEDEGLYSFKRNRNCNYHKPITEGFGNWPWVGKDENGKADKKYRFTLTSIRHPRPKCIGFARRRVGRGGRIILDRCSTAMDDFWSTLDYTIFDSEKAKIEKEQTAAVTTVAATLESHPLTTTTTLLHQQQQLIAGRVTGVRLSSATSDGTASPVSYSATTTPSILQQKINNFNVNVINSSNSGSNASATVDNHHLQQHHQSQHSIPSTTTNIQQQQQNLQPPAVVDNEPLIKIKEEHLDDYERLIDNVNNDRLSKNLSSSGGSRDLTSLRNTSTPATTTSITTSNSNTSSSNIPVTNQTSTTSSAQVSFTNEFVEYAVKAEPRLSMDSAALVTPTTSSSSTTLPQTQNNNQQQPPPNTPYSQSESRDSGISVKTEMALDDVSSPFSTSTIGLGLGTESVYDEFLSDLEKHWLHFRPKTPSSPVLPSSPPINTVVTCLDDPGLDLFGNLDMPSAANHEEAVSRLLGKPFNVELQALDTQLPAEIFAVNEDSFFVTPEPVVLDALLIDESAINKPTLSAADAAKDSGDEVNTSSGDSLNELSLGLNESNDDEKLLANILEECQMEEAKVLTQTSNFWNGLLEENTLPTQLELDDQATDSKFDRTIGYTSDVSIFTRRRPQSVSEDLDAADADDESAMVSTNNKKKRRKLSLKLAARIGHSHFKVSSMKFPRSTPDLLQLDPIKLEGVIKDEPITDPITIDLLTSATSSSSTTGIQIKAEPMDHQDQSSSGTGGAGSGSGTGIDLLQSRLTLHKHTPSTSEAISVQQHQQQQQQQHILQQQSTQMHHLHQIINKQEHVSSADATAAHDYAASPSNMPPNAVHQVISAVSSTSSPTTLTTRIPPQQQNRLQAFISSDTTAVFPGSTTTVRQMNGPAVLQNLLRTTALMHQQKGQKSDDTVLVDVAKVKQIENMLKKSSAEVTSNHNAGQPQQQQQFGIIHQNALPPQIAIIGSAQGGQGQNRIFLASSTPQPSTSTADGTIVQAGTKLHINSAGQQQQITTLTSIPNTAIIVEGKGQGDKIQQRVKLDKMLFDSDKNRILYTTNIKNSRGAPFLTQLNAPKVVNIVPIHGKNNLIAAASSQGQLGQVMTPTILRTKSDIIQRVTINNAQNIRPSNNGNGTKTVTATVSDAAKLLQTNDNNQVSGINTTSR